MTLELVKRYKYKFSTKSNFCDVFLFVLVYQSRKRPLARRPTTPAGLTAGGGMVSASPARGRAGAGPVRRASEPRWGPGLFVDSLSTALH